MYSWLAVSRMAASGVGVAPTIICVLCPEGANLGAFVLSLRSALDCSTRSWISRMVSPVTAKLFSGASLRRSASVGSSMLALSRSACRPAASMSSLEAPGTALRWM